MLRRSVDTPCREGGLEDDILPHTCTVQRAELLERVRCLAKQRLEECLRRAAMRIASGRVDVREQGDTRVKRDQLAELDVRPLFLLTR